jgi:hypothetical protein
MASTDYPNAQAVMNILNINKDFTDDVSLSQAHDVNMASNFMCECIITTTYKMYGYCTTHNILESWESIGSPDPNPPISFVSPHSIDPASIAYVIIKQEQL